MKSTSAYTRQRVRVAPHVQVNGWSCVVGYIFSKRGELARVIFDDNTMMDIPFANLEPENGNGQ